MFDVKSERWNHGLGLVRANATNVSVSYRTTAQRALNAVRVRAHSDFRALTLRARTDVPPARRGWCYSVGVTISTRAVFTPVAARDFYVAAGLAPRPEQGCVSLGRWFGVALATSGPTPGTDYKCADRMSAIGGKADMPQQPRNVR